MPVEREIVIVGSGFAGSILARMLRKRGRDVLLLEREHHPRFAIGESSTPLAGLALEQIAREYDLPDLDGLSTYGRWSKAHPELRRGLKRGFTFYRHRAGQPYGNRTENEARLLVAASPDDEVSDAHWLRADVDHYLAKKAEEEGAELWMGADAAGMIEVSGGLEVEGLREGEPFRVTAEFVVDATGSGSFLSRAVPIDSDVESLEVESAIVGGHFSGVRSFVETAKRVGARFDDAPYPEERAAVHHLLEEGWMYVLPFDHGIVSAGFLLDRRHPSTTELLALDAQRAFATVLERYPTLAACFADAVPVMPLFRAPRLQRRLKRAAGPRWLLLPHAFGFVDPMFSSGIAWSLHGVRRAARLLGARDWPSEVELQEHDALTQLELEQLEALIAGALEASSDFRLFTSWTFLYFALAAWDETNQRLGRETGAGFLGADREDRGRLLEEARSRLDAAIEGGGESSRAEFEDFVASRIASFDLVGLAEPSRRNLYPVDLEVLVERAGLLGMTGEAMREELPRWLRR